MLLESCRPDLWLWLGPAILLGSALFTIALIVPLRPWLTRFALAHPNVRSTHAVPTPQGCGIALTAAVIASSAIVFASGCHAGTTPLVQWVPLASAGMIAVVGLADDIKPIPVATRLTLQSVAVAAVVLSLPPDLDVVYMLPNHIERTLLFIGGVWFVNLTNFMDGIDWMTVAAIVPLTAGLVVLGALGAIPPIGVVVALALMGALIGFAPFNRPIAKLFMGDAGSLPIGLLVGWMLALVIREGHLIAAILLPLYYVADATITLLRRIWIREQIWTSHRTHFYQRATAGGFSVTDVVKRVFGVNVGLAALAAASVLADNLAIDLLLLALGIGLVAWLLVVFKRGKQ